MRIPCLRARRLAGLTAALCLGAMPPWALSAPAELGRTVDSLLAYAREHHPELAAMRAESTAASARADAADALPDPRVKVELVDAYRAATGDNAGSLNLAPARVAATRYTLSQELPWWGKRDLRRDVADAGVSEAQQRSEAIWRDLARNLRQTHTRHALTLARMAFAQANLGLLAQLEQIAQTRYGNGLAAQQDVIRAQTERSALLGDIAVLEGERDELAARTRALTGAPAEVRLVAPEALPAPAAIVFERSALELRVRANNPLLLAEEARILGAEKKRALTYKERWPDLSLGITPVQMRNRVDSADLMVELTIPLQQTRRRADEREAEAMVDAAQNRRTATLNDLLAELDGSLAGLAAARRMDELLASRLLPQAELTLKAALAGYETGKVDFATVLDAQRQLRRAKEDGVRARADQWLRLADIARLTGDE